MYAYMICMYVHLYVCDVILIVGKQNLDDVKFEASLTDIVRVCFDIPSPSGLCWSFVKAIALFYHITNIVKISQFIGFYVCDDTYYP